MTLSVGKKLGPYEIVGLLGEGGMGVVYRARDLHLGRDVALKVLRVLSAEEPERAARLEREARILAALNHPNIAQIYGFEMSGEIHALIMELVDGPTLAELLAQRRLSFAECLSMSTQIVQALAEAHSKGIVHRDLKPQNIKLANGGRVKVLDFGLACIQPSTGFLAAGSSTLTYATQPGAVLGTVGYMAPEQVRGETVDKRADIFSFGCVLYEMATGERPFARPSALETLNAILHDAPLAPSVRRRDLPSGLDRLVARCLEKDAAARFQSTRDLEFALDALTPPQAHATAKPRSASVAVLPFINLTPDPENEFFADGITEDVIAHLAKIRSLKVISRTSVMAFKKRDCGLREIGERLGAATLLEGSVRRAGNRVRISAQLIDGPTDEHIWAETYDRDLTDILPFRPTWLSTLPMPFVRSSRTTNAPVSAGAPRTTLELMSFTCEAATGLVGSPKKVFDAVCSTTTPPSLAILPSPSRGRVSRRLTRNCASAAASARRPSRVSSWPKNPPRGLWRSMTNLAKRMVYRLWFDSSSTSIGQAPSDPSCAPSNSAPAASRCMNITVGSVPRSKGTKMHCARCGAHVNLTHS